MKSSNWHSLILCLREKWILKNVINILYYNILSSTIRGNILKYYMQIMSWKYFDQHGRKNLNWLMNHVLAHICKIYLGISKQHDTEDNLPIQSYISEVKIRIKFKIRSRYSTESYQKLWKSKTQKGNLNFLSTTTQYHFAVVTLK